MNKMFASNNCSKKYMKTYILLLLLFCFILSSCIQSEPTSENSQRVNMNTIDSEKTITNKSIDTTDSSDANNMMGNDLFVPFENYQLKDFPDNKSLNLIENEMIKKNIINVISYLYNYNADINTIEMDEDESKEWFAGLNSNYYKVGWSISQELDYFARANEDLIVTHIDANFMIKPKNLLENDILKISVPVYESNISGNSLLGKNYDLIFKKIDGIYKLIGIIKEPFLTQEEEKVLEIQNFFGSFEANYSRAVAYKFFRAYIQNNIEEAKLLMENPDNTAFISFFSTGQKRTMDDVVWLVLKEMNYDPLTKIVWITFEFGVLPDPVLRYFGVGLMLKDGEWKVVNDAFGLEA